ncbi:MAG: ABC transporter ATP-binding protein [Lachnospiraceae bacterium]
MIQFKNVEKTYYMNEIEVRALREVSFEIKDGEFVIILGASGAGKSTILNLLGGMDTVTSGEITVDDICITSLADKALTDYRGNAVGFVFQFYNLIPNLTAYENVDFACEFTDHPLHANEVLKMVGMEERCSHFPAQLSGGEQQRVAIARAISKNPNLLLCDEPTGALDYETGRAILKLLQDINKRQNKTIILITHNTMIAPIANKVIKVKSGRIEDVYCNKITQPIERINW